MTSRSRSSSVSSSRSSTKKYRKRLSRSQSSADSAYLADSESLPSSTSHWNTLCLEKLGIFYHNEYFSSPLDIIERINSLTQCFGPMTTDQMQYIGDIIDTLTFDISMNECKEFEQDPADQHLTEVILPELEEQIKKIRQHFSKGIRVKTLPEEFLHVVTHVLRYELGRFKSIKRMGPATEDLYVSVFNLFARLCGVDTVPGSLWRTKMEVGYNDVTSTADLLIMPLECPESFRKDYPDADSVAVVSVVEVKKLSSKKVPDELCVTSSIYDDVDSKTLGQHGGELLLHLRNYEEKLIRRRRVLPGMIVIGTEVIFTVLEIDAKHLAQVYSRETVDSKAKIFYSRPMDFLKKKDRDVLMEAIIRLNNV